MNENVKEIIDRVVEDVPRLRKKMIWEFDSRSMATVSAFLYANAGKQTDIERYMECKKYFNKHVNAFSQMRGIAKTILITKMSMQEDYASYLEGVTEVYKKLRNIHKLTASPYMVLAAANIYEGGGLVKADENIEKLEELYKRMKGDHFWLTGDEDRPTLALIVSHNMDAEAITNEINACYMAAKSLSFSKESVHSAAQILAFSGKSTEVKVSELKETLDCMKKAKVKGPKYELIPAIAALGMIEKSPENKADEIKEIYEYLRGQKGFKWYMANGERSLYSILTYAIANMNGSNAVMSTVVSTTITEIVIEEIILMIMIASAVSRNASSSSSN